MTDKVSDQNLHELYENIGDLRNDFRNRNLYELICSRLKGKSVLDIGCGAGHFLNIASQKGYKAYGIEPSSKIRNLSKKLYGDKITVREGEAETIKESLIPTDNVTLIDVLEHIEKDGDFLKDLYSALDKGTRLVILVPAYQALYGKRDESIGHFRRYNSRTLKNVVENAGFYVKEVRYWNTLGILPYFLSEKILNKPLKAGFREKEKKGIGSKVLNRTLFTWFKTIENPINFNFGLSVVCVAEK